MTVVPGYSYERLFPAEKVKSHSIKVDDYDTHYLESGAKDAEPLVLLHGGPGAAGLGIDRWYPVVPVLGEKFHVFALDELGHGLTDAPRVKEELGNTLVRAEHAIAFIEALKVGPVHLLGQSQGGMMAAYIALKRPDLIRKLVIVDSASTSGIEVAKLTEKSELLPYNKNVHLPGTRIPKVEMRTREAFVDHWKEFFFNHDMITEGYIENALALSAVWHDRYLESLREIWGHGELEGLKQRQRQYSINGAHISESVHLLKPRTLVVWGKQSNKGVDGGVTLFKKIPDAQMHIFDKANHFVWMDQPKAFNSLITWYLREG